MLQLGGSGETLLSQNANANVNSTTTFSLPTTPTRYCHALLKNDTPAFKNWQSPTELDAESSCHPADLLPLAKASRLWHQRIHQLPLLASSIAALSKKSPTTPKGYRAQLRMCPFDSFLTLELESFYLNLWSFSVVFSFYTSLLSTLHRITNQSQRQDGGSQLRHDTAPERPEQHREE